MFTRPVKTLFVALALMSGIAGQSAVRASAIVSSTVQGTTVTDNGVTQYTTFPTLLGVGVSITSLIGDAPIVSGGTQNYDGTIITTTSGLVSAAALTQYSPSGTIGWNPYAPDNGSYWDTNNGADWLSIGGASGNASATFGFASPASSLSFVWGSPSPGNIISLYGQNGLISTVSTDGSENVYINGTQVLSGIANLVNSYVAGATITISSLQGITSAVFSTTQGGGFEIGGVTATSVPEPSSLAILMLGLVALMFIRRKTAGAGAI